MTAIKEKHRQRATEPSREFHHALKVQTSNSEFKGPEYSTRVAGQLRPLTASDFSSAKSIPMYIFYYFLSCT